jgi:hypothetical protein
LSKLPTLPPELQAAGKQYWEAIERMAQEEQKKERALPTDRVALLNLLKK